MLEKHGWDIPGGQYAALYRSVLPNESQAGVSVPPAAAVRKEGVYAHS
jgi:hypothetical protein